MGETFFSSKDAAKITGCTLRQLQYWREKGVIVPMVSATGTGRSVYYSRSELVELSVMVYLLSVGLTFESASGVLQQLREIEPNFAEEKSQRRLMLVFDPSEGILRLKDFERESAIAFLDKGLPVIPLWLDRIYQNLVDNLDRDSLGTGQKNEKRIAKQNDVVE